MKKALKRHGAPQKITTDGIRSYKAAINELGNAEKQEMGRWANSRVENSHGGSLSWAEAARPKLELRQSETSCE